MPTVTAQLRAATSLAAATEAAMAQVRQAPGHAGMRTGLFQLFCLNGAWQRALVQLGSAGRLDAGCDEMARVYREVIRCEVMREAVFGGTRSPLFLGQPQAWLAELLEALRLDALGHAAAAAQLRAGALQNAPAAGGSIDGARFAWLADADSRLGPVQEAIVNGKYYWIAFAQLRQIEIEAPTDLRDLVWIPARLSFANGGQQVAFIPVRYPGLGAADDDALRMARRTEWRALGEGSWAGAGQRMYASDQGEYALLATRLIEFDAVAAETEDRHG